MECVTAVANRQEMLTSPALTLTLSLLGVHICHGMGFFVTDFDFVTELVFVSWIS